MSYREPRPQQSSSELAELSAYEAKLLRQARRKKIVLWGVFAGLLTAGLGSCFGPIAWTIGEESWKNRKVPLTKAEQKKLDDALLPIETNAKKSQAAFELIWPKIKSQEIGARKDLGACAARVPGPELRRKEQSRSLEDSAGAYGWTFIDVTPADARSPIATIKMPRGSLALNNTGYGERYVVPPEPLNTAPADKAPALASSSLSDLAGRLRDDAKTLRANDHESFFDRVSSFVDDGMGIDVVVFLDVWSDPKMTHEVAPAPPPPKDDLEAFTRPTERPALLFEAGFAIAHAIAWDPAKQQIVCASQAVATSSEDITFRAGDPGPLQQDLVLELERALERSFVAVGDAPPKLEPPPRRALGSDGGVPNATSPDADRAPPKRR